MHQPKPSGGSPQRKQWPTWSKKSLNCNKNCSSWKANSTSSKTHWTQWQTVFQILELLTIAVCCMGKPSLQGWARHIASKATHKVLGKSLPSLKCQMEQLKLGLTSVAKRSSSISSIRKVFLSTLAKILSMALVTNRIQTQ